MAETVTGSLPPVGGDTCPACGSAEAGLMFYAGDRLYATTPKRFAVIECQTCRLIRLSPRPAPSERPGHYPEDYWHVPEGEFGGHVLEAGSRLLLRDHVRFVERALERARVKGPVIDVGCGGGLFLKVLRERGHQGIGLDFALSAARAAWEFNEVPTVCGTLTSAPWRDGSAAAVTMFHVLQHLYEPASYLEAAHRLLQPGGCLIVQVPNAASWQFLLLGEDWRGLDVPRHIWNFRVRDLEILLDRSGFEVVRTKHFCLRDNAAFLATSLAPGLDPAVRRIRGVAETKGWKIVKDGLYAALTLLSLPLAIVEAACFAGGTVMVEARKKP